MAIVELHGRHHISRAMMLLFLPIASIAAVVVAKRGGMNMVGELSDSTVASLRVWLTFGVDLVALAV